MSAETQVVLDETPVYIPAGDATIFGVFSEPAAPRRGVAVVLLLGGIYTLSFNRNRLSVRLARDLAAMGFHVLRLELHGSGESTGVVGEYRLDKPWTEDLMAAIRWVEDRGVSRFVLAGSCFGGRTCLAATENIAELRGLALVSVPVTDQRKDEMVVTHRSHLSGSRFVMRAFRMSVLRGFLRRKSRARYGRILRAKVALMLRRRTPSAPVSEPVSERYLSSLAALVRRRVPLLIANGTEDLASDYYRARPGAIERILHDAGEQLDEIRFDEWTHGFPSLAIQEKVMGMLRAWIERVAVVKEDGR